MVYFTFVALLIVNMSSLKYDGEVMLLQSNNEEEDWIKGGEDRKDIARQFNNINNHTTRTADNKEKENLQYYISSHTVGTSGAHKQTKTCVLIMHHN